MLPTTRPRTRSIPASATFRASAPSVAGFTPGSPCPRIHRFRTAPEVPPDAATLVVIRKSAPNVSYNVIESRSFSFDAGVRGLDAARW